MAVSYTHLDVYKRQVLLCIILIHAVFVLDKKKDIDKIFIKICMTNILLLILEICDVFLSSRSNIEFITIHKVINLVGFLLAPIIPILLCNMANSWIYDFKDINKRYKSLFYIPYVIYSFICILSWKYGFVFKISDLNIYSRGGLFLIVPIVSYGSVSYTHLDVYKRQYCNSYIDIYIG